MEISIGRIVHYHEPDGVIRPAIVTHVFNVAGHEGMVNLNVFRDRFGEAPVEIRTSVEFGSTPGRWSWPPGVAETTIRVGPPPDVE